MLFMCCRSRFSGAARNFPFILSTLLLNADQATVMTVVMSCPCTFLCCTLVCDWQHVLGCRKVSFQNNGCKIPLNETLLAHWAPLFYLISQCTTVCSFTHIRVGDFWSFLFMHVSPFCLSLILPLLLLPFPHPLCVGAKPSNGCWHILESCCPTRSLSSAGQVHGSERCNLAVDETKAQMQLARPPTIAFRAAHLFRSQVKSGGIFLYPDVQNPPHQRVLDLLMRDIYAAKETQNRLTELWQCHFLLTWMELGRVKRSGCRRLLTRAHVHW